MFCKIMESILNSEVKPVIELIQLIDNSLAYFDNERKSPKLILNLRRFKFTVEKCLKFVEEIEKFAHEYDFDEETCGNGFRSFIDIFDAAVQRALRICRKLIISRKKIIFRADQYNKYIDDVDYFKESLLTFNFTLQGSQ